MSTQVFVFRNISQLLTLKGAYLKKGRHIQKKDLGLISKAAFVVYKGKVYWVGRESQFSKAILKKLQKEMSLKKIEIKEVDMSGQTVLPGFVESHTHLVFSGDRKDEFELRNQGVSYTEIAQRGGGILSTVKATRRASESNLLKKAQLRVNQFVNQGVTTLEVKSGYALDFKNELKMLKVIQALRGPKILATYLGAHALAAPQKSFESYMDFICSCVLPKISEKKLAQRVDIFVDEGYFSRAHARQYFKKAQSLGMDLTLHADQIKRTQAYQLAIQWKALSADHLVQLKSSDIKKLALSEVTCNLLPGADFYLRMSYPPARALVDAGARISLATDFNPGSCPTQDLSLIGVLARLEMKLTLPEVICAYTLGASYALGLHHSKGALLKGMDADFISLNSDYRELFYQVGVHPVVKSWRKGKKLKK